MSYMDKLRGRAEDLSKKAKPKAEELREKAKPLAEKARDRAGKMAKSARESAVGFREGLQGTEQDTSQQQTASTDEPGEDDGGQPRPRPRPGPN